MNSEEIFAALKKAALKNIEQMKDTETSGNEQTRSSSHCSAFEVWVASVPEFRKTINARTANKATYEFLIDLRDSWPDYEYKDLRVRKLGDCISSERFIHNAKYRGAPDVRCGQRVSVGDGRGVIVGHNASANFDVLFDDDSPKYAGLRLNVHPVEVQYA